MALRLWGCFSVADHLAERAFVADLLLYDRLVVPVPSDDDMDRWEAQWNPARQAELLAIAEPFIERVVWTPSLREHFDREFSPALASFEIDGISAYAAKRCPYEVTRQVISDHLRDEVSARDGDVLSVAVYAEPDRFDREWEIVRTFPFVRRHSVVEPGELREVVQVLSTEQQRLARLVVTRLVVPDEGSDDMEVLKRTVDLISKRDVAEHRAAFQELIAAFTAKSLRDDTIVGEVQDLVRGLNESVRRHTKAQRSRTALHVLTAGEGAAALWSPPLAAAIGPTAAIGEALIGRRWGEDSTANFGAVNLLAAAQRALSA